MFLPRNFQFPAGRSCSVEPRPTRLRGRREAWASRLGAAACALIFATPAATIGGAEHQAEGRAINEEQLLEVVPAAYAHALRNPLKGPTGRELSGREWATLTHHDVPWDEIGSVAADGIGEIRVYCDQNWQDLAERNIKVTVQAQQRFQGKQHCKALIARPASLEFTPVKLA